MTYRAEPSRYEKMQYARCGNSGLLLPRISFGLWHNFGDATIYENSRNMACKAFDLGITHFDIANNYGPAAGSAEINFGRMMREDFKPYRDEMIISSKAGHYMWPGPYGDLGSRKHLLASLDQSLKRLGLEYVDIFYHHRPDSDTPLEESMAALDQMVRQGKALYIGISSYDAEDSRKAIQMLKRMGTPCLIHQPRYSMLHREPEEGLFKVLKEEKVGSIVYCPLNGGMLTDRYLNGIPADSRAAGHSIFLNTDQITEEIVYKVKKLNEIAAARGQKLAQMALAWVLKQNEVTSALIGASKVSQIEDCVAALDNLDFTDEELSAIESVLV